MCQIRVSFRKTLDTLKGRTCRELTQFQAGERLFALKAKEGVLVEMVDLKDFNDVECLYFIVKENQFIPKQRKIFDYELAFENSENDEVDYSSEYVVYVKEEDMVTRVTLGNEGLYAYMKYYETEEGTDFVDTDILNEAILERFHFCGDAEFLDYFGVDEINW